MNYSENANRGAKLLDLAHPGWAKQIDQITLIEQRSKDVATQLFGDYQRAMRLLDQSTAPQKVSNGFAPNTFEQRDAIALAEAWRREIQSRS